MSARRKWRWNRRAERRLERSGKAIKKYRKWLSPFGKLAAGFLLCLAVCTSAFAAGLPTEPRSLSEFEEVWDYAAANDADHIEIHYAEKQSVNTYYKYEKMTQLMSEKYRYVHPEYFNYLRLKDCSFVDDEGGRYGFTMVLEFDDLDSTVKREYYAIAVEEARELYLEAARNLSPTLSQRRRAELLCEAIAEKVDYKNDRTGLCHTAYCALVNGYAVCDGYTSLLNMLLRMDGIECEGRVGNAAGGRHSWTYANLDGDWVNIDATWFDGSHSGYVGLTDEEIASTHTVDSSYEELRKKDALADTRGTPPVKEE